MKKDDEDEEMIDEEMCGGLLVEKRKAKRGHGHQGQNRTRRGAHKFQVDQLCRVCAEQAAGYHYGVFTCEGCKSFFGRYQKGKRKPPQECMNGHGQCDVQSRSRNRCRYCRYQKCLSAGMSKTASRYGRRSNWFKVHCLSESKRKDKPGSNPDHSVSIMPDEKHSSPSRLSVIVSPVNSKPSVQPYQRPIPSGPPTASPDPFYPAFIPTSLLIPAPSYFPLHSGPTPILGRFPISSLGPITFPHYGSLESSSSQFGIQPIQTEPLDLSLKRP